MTIPAVGEFYLEVKKGNIPGHSLIHKFGHGSIGATLAVVSNAGIWKTPTTATALEFVSDSVNDTAGGSGATEITIQGLNANWEQVTQTIATNGTTAVSIPFSLLRLYRWYVSKSGVYSDETTASHDGELKIRVSGAGATWSTITGADPYSAQSEIGMVTIPRGYTGYLLSHHAFVDTNKTASVFLIQRPHADDVNAPFEGTRRLLVRSIGVSGGYNVVYRSPKGPFSGPCDIGFMANAAATSDISVEFEILLIEDGY